MRVPSVAPRGADVVGSLKVCRGGTTVGETREEGGVLILKYTPFTLVEKENFTEFVKFVKNEKKTAVFCKNILPKNWQSI